MIAILPAAESERQTLLRQAGLSGPAECLTVREGGERLGAVLFRRQGETVEIFAARAADASLLDGLLRAALNAALNAGARPAVCSEEALFPALRALGFLPSGEHPGRLQAALSAVFSKGCPGGCRL